MVSPSNGQDYSALQQNNPYRNYQYTQSAWDKIGSWLNNNVFKSDFLKTKEMSVADEMANKANAYDAQIGEVQREEAYNSPEEQAQRMRAAGINPELENSGISGGQASEFDNQAASGMPTAAELQQVSDDTGNLMSAVIAIPSTVLGVLNSGVDLAAKSVALEGSLNQLFKSTNDAAKDFISQYITSTGDLADLKDMSDRQLLSIIMKDPSLQSQYPLVSMRQRVAKSVIRQIRSMDIETSIYNSQGQLYGARTNPMNFDEESARIIMDWTYKFNQARLKALTRQHDADYLDADMRALRLEALQSIINQFQDLYDETNVRSYAYATTIANQIMSGQIDDAIKSFAASKLLEGAIAGKDFLSRDDVQDSLGQGLDDISSDPTGVGSGLISGAKDFIESSGAGTTIDNDGNIVVTEYPDGTEPDSPKGRAYRRMKIFMRARDAYRHLFSFSPHTSGRRRKKKNFRNRVDEERSARKSNDFSEKYSK